MYSSTTAEKASDKDVWVLDLINVTVNSEVGEQIEMNAWNNRSHNLKGLGQRQAAPFSDFINSRTDKNGSKTLFWQNKRNFVSSPERLKVSFVWNIHKATFDPLALMNDTFWAQLFTYIVFYSQHIICNLAKQHSDHMVCHNDSGTTRIWQHGNISATFQGRSSMGKCEIDT